MIENILVRGPGEGQFSQQQSGPRAPGEPCCEERSLDKSVDRLYVGPDYSVAVEDGEVDRDGEPDDGKEYPREANQDFCLRIFAPRESQEQGRLVANHFEQAEDVMQGMGIGEDADAYAWHGHEADNPGGDG